MSTAEQTNGYTEDKLPSANKLLRPVLRSARTQLVEWVMQHRRESAAGVVVFLMMLLMLKPAATQPAFHGAPMADQDSISELFAELDAERAAASAIPTAEILTAEPDSYSPTHREQNAAWNNDSGVPGLRIPSEKQTTTTASQSGDSATPAQQQPGRIRFSGLLRPAE